MICSKTYRQCQMWTLVPVPGEAAVILRVQPAPGILTGFFFTLSARRLHDCVLSRTVLW